MCPTNRQPRSRLRQAITTLATVFLLAVPAPAMINVQLTPRDLIAATPAIVELQAGPLAKEKSLPVNIVKAHKGAAPEKIAITVGELPQAVEDQLTRALAPDAAVTAVYFAAGAAPATNAAPGNAEPARPAGHLLVGSYFFALYPAEGGGYRLAEDPTELRTVWAGTAGMFLRLMDALNKDPKLDVPVKGNATWSTPTLIAKLPGQVQALQVVELTPGRPMLLALSSTGDRAFAREADKAPADKPLADVTATLKLESKSRFALAGDFSASGRLDLLTSDGATLILHRHSTDHALAATSLAVKLPAEIRSLALGPAGSARATAILGAAPVPLLLTFDDKGQPAIAPVAGAAEAKLLTSLGDGGAAVCADFDGDGHPDIVQVFANGALFYKGSATGFAAPTLACRSKLSAKPAALSPADFDADGLLDLMVTGDGGNALLHNLGQGRFLDHVQDAGEIGYDDKLEATAGTVMDFNADGRPDIVLGIPSQLPFPFFNRGFFTFGVANDMLLDAAPVTGQPAPAAQAAKDLRGGTAAVAAGDFTGDGLQDLVVLSKEGHLWLIPSALPAGRKPLSVTLAAPAGQLGPVTFTAQAGRRTLGARLLAPGQPAFLGLAEPALLEVTPMTSPATPATRIGFMAAPKRAVMPPSP